MPTSTTYTPRGVNPNPPQTSGSGSYSYTGSYSPGSASQTAQHQFQHPSQQPPYYPNSTTTPYASLYPPPSNTPPLHNNTNPGSYGGVDSAGLDSEAEAGVWGSAKSWLQSAGNKLADAEAEVWRRINDAHD
ncbi:hypothetical protein BDW59DRAFT_144788, partial [Aspergillus cavernicola]